MLNQLPTICAALRLDPLERGLQLLDARALVPDVPPPPDNLQQRAWAEMQGVGPYTPPLMPFPLVTTRPALLAGLDTVLAASVQAALLQRYPVEHSIALVVAADNAQAQHSILGDLAQLPLGDAAFLFLPPLAPLADLRGPDGVASVVARLLGPHGCPWDREQTHRSLRRELLEETHEVLEALDADDSDALSDELGDLLLQVLMHSEMARQANEFVLGDVYQAIAAKLIRRHPHIFGDTAVSGTGEVLRNWDTIKQAERAAKGQAPRGMLDGIAVGLPALAAAQKMITKAAKAGFDAPEIAYSWAKLREELDELRAAAETEQHADDSARARRVEEEYGDLLLAFVKLAVRLGLEPESALRAASEKFRQRFGRVEQRVLASGSDLHTLSVAEKEALWREAKRMKN